MNYSAAKTSALFRGRGPNFDIYSHAGMLSLCQAGGPTVMGNGQPSLCPFILI